MVQAGSNRISQTMLDCLAHFTCLLEQAKQGRLNTGRDAEHGEQQNQDQSIAYLFHTNCIALL
jgi:hypothetical protein